MVIDGSPQACFDAIVDYETFPDWQRAVKSVDVLTLDSDGRGREVAFEIDAKLKTVRYTLEYSYEEPHWIGWDYLEGDVKEINGEYTFEDLGDGTTRATYTLEIDPGGFVPGPLKKVLSDQVMKASVEDLRRHLER